MAKNSVAMLHLEKAVSGQSKIRVAIADADSIFRDGLSRLLASEEDFEVVAQAQDVRQVVDVLQQHQPDILLLDLKMPGLDGLGALQRLSLAKGKTRVILLAASVDRDALVQAMKLGAAGIVLKQRGTEPLIKCIRRVHVGEICLDSHIQVSHSARIITVPAIRQSVANDKVPAPPAQPPAPRNRSPLSQRERETVALVARGFKNIEIAKKMFISEQTVKNHLKNICDKLGVSNRLDLALYAVRNRLQ